MTQDLQAKYNALKDNLKSIGGVVVAASGGVDSSLLVKVAHDVLGSRCVAITAASDFIREDDVTEARDLCRAEGVTHEVMDFPILEVPHVKDNPPDRCYYCKYALFKHLKARAGELGLAAVVEGTNIDDDGERRPGRTALRELHIVSPLHDAGFTKNDIRALARELGTKFWDKPSSACLATRFAYGSHLTPEKLRRAAQAEDYLHTLGLTTVRVRVEGETARIELLPAEMERALAPERRAAIERTLRGYGYAHVSIDLTGYRRGSMDEGVKGID